LPVHLPASLGVASERYVKTSDFDFELPPALIAQHPPAARDAARMLVLRRASAVTEHARVTDLPGLLSPGDLLVANDTRVLPARLFGERAGTGGRAEVLLLEPLEDGDWTAFLRAGGRPRAGDELVLAGGEMRATVVAAEPGRVRLRLRCERPLDEVLEAHGVPPLPPYIRRPRGVTPATAEDRARYQTVFARAPGAVAAPTAGLHFTPELLSACRARGIGWATITLHVGPGTFRPVRAEDPTRHAMESERFEVGADAARRIAEARAAGGRVVAVGSTVVRTLESVARAGGDAAEARTGRTDLFIRPPFEFRAVGAMLTNFHLPRSTLLMMVCALAGRDFVLDAYREAVRMGYRFYSYGDCMLIL
jgi:S-adenosylmethionine:tRNA ribosyltransferase-isomerase